MTAAGSVADTGECVSPPSYRQSVRSFAATRTHAPGELFSDAAAADGLPPRTARGEQRRPNKAKSSQNSVVHPLHAAVCGSSVVVVVVVVVVVAAATAAVLRSTSTTGLSKGTGFAKNRLALRILAL